MAKRKEGRHLASQLLVLMISKALPCPLYMFEYVHSVVLAKGISCPSGRQPAA